MSEELLKQLTEDVREIRNNVAKTRESLAVLEASTRLKFAGITTAATLLSTIGTWLLTHLLRGNS